MDVLDTQAWIRLVEPDRSAIRSRCEVNELLEILSAGRRWRALGELEQQIENLPDILGEICDVLVERTVIDREETNLVVLERHELRKVRGADFVEIFGCTVSPRAQDELYFDEGDS